jgi:putative colanic acid biosynthesis glycosyltransferase WcaI
MKIMMLAQHYAPEEVSGAVLATELAEDLALRGHQVTFVTCAPNYPQGQVFSGYSNALHAVEMRNGVKIIRMWSHITPNKGFGARVINYSTFSAMAFFGGLVAGEQDVIFSYSPPLPLGIAAWLLSRLHRIPWVLRVEDLYPDAAVAAGVLRNRTAIAVFVGLEKCLYQKAAHISLISEGFRQNLLGKGIAPEKLSVAPVWADPDVIRPLPKENAFRQEHGLRGKFVVLYAGNLGITSLLEDVIAAAALLQDDPDIVFLLVGEGVKKEALMQQAQGLKQVHFLPYQPRSVLPELMAAADISLVTLNPASSSYSLPSKVFNIMASGRPILAITPSESEVARLVEIARCGCNVSPESPAETARRIRQLKNARPQCEVWGQNGRSYLDTEFTRRRCVDLYEATLQRVIG